MKLTGQSKTQPWKDGLEVIETNRIAAIVLSADKTKVMLIENLDPKIEMLSCPNWNLRWKENSIDTLQKLLYDRSGHKSIKSIKTLEGEIHWKFRKKDPLPNEDWIYDNSVYLVQLNTMDKMSKRNYIDPEYFLIWKDRDLSSSIEPFNDSVLHIHWDKDWAVPLASISNKFTNKIIVKGWDHDMEIPNQREQWFDKAKEFLKNI